VPGKELPLSTSAVKGVVLLRLAGQAKLILNLVDFVFEGLDWLPGTFGLIELLLRRRQSLLKSDMHDLSQRRPADRIVASHSSAISNTESRMGKPSWNTVSGKR
jgi:hypothetical protein